MAHLPAERLRAFDDARPRFAGPLYYRRILDEMIRDVRLDARDRDVFLHILLDEPFDAIVIRKTAKQVAQSARVCYRTARDSIDRLADCGYLRHERDPSIPGSPYVFVLEYNLGAKLKLEGELAEPGEVYSGTRLGDRSSYDRRKVARRPSATTARRPGATTARHSSAAPYWFERESTERETTTTAPVTASADPGGPSSSSLSPSVEDREASGEAPGSPQAAPQSGDVRSAVPAGEKPPWAVQACERAAKLRPFASPALIDLWIGDCAKTWRAAVESSGRPSPAARECVDVAVLAIEYASLMPAAKDVGAYQAGEVRRWANERRDLAWVETLVASKRPAPVVAAPPAVAPPVFVDRVLTPEEDAEGAAIIAAIRAKRLRAEAARKETGERGVSPGPPPPVRSL